MRQRRFIASASRLAPSHGKLVDLLKPFLPPPKVPSRGDFRLAAVKQSGKELYLDEILSVSEKNASTVAFET